MDIQPDTLFNVSGYAVEVVEQSGYMSLRMDYGDYDYRLPDGYIGVTFHDNDGNECYLFVPGPEDEDEDEEDEDDTE